jgi:hypothetical protein
VGGEKYPGLRSSHGMAEAPSWGQAGKETGRKVVDQRGVGILNLRHPGLAVDLLVVHSLNLMLHGSVVVQWEVHTCGQSQGSAAAVMEACRTDC